MEQHRVVVFACGHPLYGDASVAQQAVMELPPSVLELVDVKLIGPLQPEYLRDLPVGAQALVIDAVVGPEPGDIIEILFVEMNGRSDEIMTTSTHPQSLDQVVAMGQLLRNEPVRGLFVGLGVEARVDADSGELSEGHTLTDPEKVALPALRDAIARAIETLDS